VEALAKVVEGDVSGFFVVAGDAGVVCPAGCHLVLPKGCVEAVLRQPVAPVSLADFPT